MVDDQCKNIAEFKEKAASSGGKAFGYLEAKVTEVSQRNVNKKDGSTGVITTLAVEDATGSFQVEIWDDTTGWKAGDVFSGTALYVSEYKGEQKLSASKKSKISKKLPSGKMNTVAKPTATKAGGSGTSSGGGGTMNTVAIEKKIDNMKGEILNAIKQFQVAIVDQMKEVLKQAMGPSEGGEEAGEQEGAPGEPSEEATNEESTDQNT